MSTSHIWTPACTPQSSPPSWILPHTGTSAFDLNITLVSIVGLDVVGYARTLLHSPNISDEALLKTDSAREGAVLPWMLKPRGFTQTRTQPFANSTVGTRSRSTTQPWSHVPICSLPPMKSSIFHRASRWSFNFPSWAITCFWDTEMEAWASFSRLFVSFCCKESGTWKMSWNSQCLMCFVK